MPYNNNNCDCRMDDIEYTIVLNEQGPQGRQGRQGEDGFSPSITVSVDTPSVYQLTITTKDQVINTPNLKANIPDPTFDGAVLTVNEDAALGYAWQELPWARTDQRGIVQLATDSDLTPDPELGYNDVVPTIEQLADEITNRTTADTTLQANITAEQTAREAADTTLQTNIENEASARQSADTTLQNNIDSLEQSLDNGLATKQDTLTAGANIEITSENVINNTYSYTLPQATSETLGGIKANARTEDDTQEVKIDTTTGILYTSPTGGTGGTNDYTELENKPSINNVTLQGDITLDQLGVQASGNYVTTDTIQDVTAKKRFTDSASLSPTSKLTMDDSVNEYDLIYSNGLGTYIGDARTATVIYTKNNIRIEKYETDDTTTSYINIDSGNLSEYTQPLLTNLATKDELESLSSTVTGLETSKQDVLTAGDGISIQGNVISATGGGSGGGGDAYTKAETDSLLNNKQDLINSFTAPLEYLKQTTVNQNKTFNQNNFTQGNIEGYNQPLPSIIYKSNDKYEVNVAGYTLEDNTPCISLPNSLVYKGNVSDKFFSFSGITSGSSKWCNAGLLFCNVDNNNRLKGFIGVYVKPTGTTQSIEIVEFNNEAILEGVSSPSRITFTDMPFWGRASDSVPDVDWGENSIIFARVYANVDGATTLDYVVKAVAGDGTIGSTIKQNTITITGSNYAGNNVNTVLFPIRSNQTYNYNRLGAYDLSLNQVWSAQDAYSFASLKLNYDDTLTLNNNQLSVDTSGLDIPTTTSQLTNDSGFITNTVNNLTNYTPTSGLATVATSGSYDDLTNKPTIPSEYELPAATTTTLGGVKPDGTTITVTSDGTISAVGGGGSGDNYVTLDTEQEIGSYKTFANGAYGRETAVTASTWELSNGCLLGEHNSDTNTYIPYILKANPNVGGNLPLGLYIGNPTEGIYPQLVAFEGSGQGNYEYPQTFYHSTTGDNQSFPLLDTKNFQHFITAGDGITITSNDVGYTISGSGAAADAATLSGNNTFTGSNTFNGAVAMSTATVGGGAVITANNVGTYAATTTQGTNADTAIANLNGFKFWSGSQAEYDGLATKDNTTLYIITGE